MYTAKFGMNKNRTFLFPTANLIQNPEILWNSSVTSVYGTTAVTAIYSGRIAHASVFSKYNAVWLNLHPKIIDWGIFTKYNMARTSRWSTSIAKSESAHNFPLPQSCHIRGRSLITYNVCIIQPFLYRIQPSFFFCEYASDNEGHRHISESLGVDILLMKLITRY
jgi:hypothetical protein